MHINISENLWNQHLLRYPVRLNFEKELKSTVWGENSNSLLLSH